MCMVRRRRVPSCSMRYLVFCSSRVSSMNQLAWVALSGTSHISVADIFSCTSTSCSFLLNGTLGSDTMKHNNLQVTQPFCWCCKLQSTNCRMYFNNLPNLPCLFSCDLSCSLDQFNSKIKSDELDTRFRDNPSNWTFNLCNSFALRTACTI